MRRLGKRDFPEASAWEFIVKGELSFKLELSGLAFGVGRKHLGCQGFSMKSGLMAPWELCRLLDDWQADAHVPILSSNLRQVS